MMEKWHIFMKEMWKSLDWKALATPILNPEEEWGTGERGDFPHFMLKEYDQRSTRQCLRGRLQLDIGSAKLED